MHRPEPVLVLEDVHHGYRHAGARRVVLDGVDLTVGAGEAVGIHGPSGTGKSTLLRVVSGWEAPTAGGVWIADRPVWRRRRRGAVTRRSLPPGAVMSIDQDPLEALDPWWSIRRTLSEPMLVRGRRVPRAERRRRVRHHLDAVGLSHLSGRERPSELSVGQCQRIAVIRALLAEPLVLVADEPTSALDVMSRLAVAHLLRGAVDGGVSLVLVSHDVALLRTICDRVHELRDGRLRPAT